MNKELLSFLTIFIALIVGAIYYSSPIQDPIISALNSVKSSYHSSVEYVQNKFHQHLFQSEHIEELEAKLKLYEKNHLVQNQLAHEIKDLFANKSTFHADPRVELTRSISYVKFGDMNKVWLEINDLNSSKIYGLVFKDLVAGIVVFQSKKPMALLNKDIKSLYSVYVGKQNAPGIAHGNNASTLIVKFIPTWFDIKVGDEVTTSGLDNIFFKGLKVGKVLSVNIAEGYQSAVIEPYYKSNDPDYFYVIKSVR